jgi:3-hydroxybutyryl-CoA dehydrogenase
MTESSPATVRVGIVGFGKMGRSMFSLFSDTPMAVIVVGRDPAEMERQNQRLEKRLRRAVGTGMLSEADLSRRLADLRFTTSAEELRECDLIVETISENFDAKVEVLRRIEALMSPRAVLTSNTSSLSLARLAEHLRDPARFCGFHFFHPVQLTKIVEIVTTPQTAPDTVELLRTVSRDIDRAPLVVKDLVGSCLNVPLLFFCREALYVLEQGLASPSRVDEIATRIGRIGPCETVDAIGLPLCLQILRVAQGAFEGSGELPELCHRLMRDGRLGRYATRGIYMYRDDRPYDDDPAYYVVPSQTHSRAGARADEAGLYERLLFLIYRCLLEIAQRGLADLSDVCFGVARMLDLTLDPLAEMRRLGSSGLREMFDRLRDELGPRFDWRPVAGAMATLDRP